MLRPVFYSEKIKYKTGESLQQEGLHSLTCTPTKEPGNTNLIIHGLINGTTWRGWRFHSITGKFVKEFTTAPERATTTTYITTSRTGKFWASNYDEGKIWRIHYGNIVTMLSGDEIDKEEPFWVLDGEEYDASHFVQPPVDADTNPNNIPPFKPGRTFAIDDLENRFMSSAQDRVDMVSEDMLPVYSLAVFNWKTGEPLYDLPVSNEIVNIALEDASRCYCLLQNRMLVLIDYMRGEILGAAKIPPLITGDEFGGPSGLQFEGIRMAYDKSHRRLSLIEKTPDDANGACTMQVVGYRTVPEPIRVTTPIPLQVPKPGRTIQVLVQVVDDMNHGVGGYAVEATVTGAGKLIGQPITDFNGNAVIGVECQLLPGYLPSGPSGS